MIKKILIAALIAVPMCVSAQAVKLGTVNTQQVFEAMPERTQAENTLQEVTKKYEDELKVLQNEGQKKFTEYQSLAQDASTPASIRDLRMQEISDIQTKIENFQRMASQDIQQQQEKLLAPISEKIRTAVQAVGKENGFTMIFDLGMGNIMYTGADAQDITGLVKAKLGIK